jgi:ASC-1-like (ASCH) protein
VTDHVRTMSIYERNLAKIAAGDKTIEVRVAYPNNRRLKAGQLLRFLSGDDLECLTRIVRVAEYPTFDVMLDHEDPLAIGYTADTTRPEMLARLREIFPAHKEALGVLAIELTLDTTEP